MSERQSFSAAARLPHTDPVRWLTWGYIVALAIIGFMSVTIHLMIDRIVAEQENVTTIVQNLETLQSFQHMAIVTIVATLIAEAFFIYMPLVRRVRNYADQLKLITMTDALTGIGNRRYFMFRGIQEIHRCRRLKKDMCLALIDLDCFKNINDSYGHKSGDMVLQKFVDIAQDCIRQEDVLARIGGEEFAVLLPHTSIDDAMKVIERMREMIDQADFDLDNDFKTRLTISAGVTRVNLTCEDFETSLVLADVALYDAKRTGRNKVIFKEAENFFETETLRENVIPIKPA